MEIDELRKALKDLAGGGQISHAYIFEGQAEDCLKLSEELAEALVTSPADILLPEHEKPELFSVKDVRDNITGSVYIRPYGEGKKVYIIRDAQLMNVQAQNALLKTIEEPPEYAVLLLLTDNSETFLETILSRCVRVRVPELNHGPSGEEREIRETVLQLFAERPYPGTEKILNFVSQAARQKLYGKQTLEVMRSFMRDVLLKKAGGTEELFYHKDRAEAVGRYAKAMSFEGIERTFRRIDEAGRRLDANVNFELTMEELWIGILEEL